ncbi:MAG: hypothetical protein JOZ22_05655 [Acidobacteriia bacterium]|nr:hypothetical protein [Terriglobia bacterium]
MAYEPVIRFLRARNRNGYDVFFRPFVPGRNSGYILVDLDDARCAVLDAMFDNGHEPCVVTETSPGRFQAWVRISMTPLPFATATAIARQLARLYQADRASADGRHLGRLAGFTNQKPQRRLVTGLAPWVKVQYAALMMASQAPALNFQAAPSRSAVQTVKPVLAYSGSHADFSPVAAADAFTAGHAAMAYQSLLQRLRILPRFPAPDWSIVDLWIAKELLRRHVPPQRVKTVLRLASPYFPRSHADPEDYLQRTLARALHDLSCAPFPARDARCCM